MISCLTRAVIARGDGGRSQGMPEDVKVRGMLLALSRSPRKLGDLAKLLALSQEEVSEMVNSLVRDGLAVYIDGRPFPTLRGFYTVCRQGELLDVIARLSEKPSTERSLSKQLGMSRKRLKYLLRVLQLEGFITREGRKYVVTGAGSRWALAVLSDGCSAGLPSLEEMTVLEAEATMRDAETQQISEVSIPPGDLVRVRINPYPTSNPMLVSPAVVKDELSDVEILYGGTLKLFRSGVYFDGHAVTGKWLAKFTKKGEAWSFFLPSRSIKTLRVVKKLFRRKRLLLEGITMEGRPLNVTVILDPNYVRKYLVGTALASTLLSSGGEIAEMLDIPDLIGDTVASGSQDIYDAWERALTLLRR